MSTNRAVTDTAEQVPYVLQTRDGAVVRLTLNRGSRFNPLSMDMILALASLVARLEPSGTPFSPGRPVGGYLRGEIADPFGNRIVLLQLQNVTGG